mmetsp:Transcript_25973/g.27077  ORF Transcript_25973/g.27077 Transcript_25973/m.27077 type:complete len:114 (-) Transcript_25973:51-392(-)
MKDTEHKLSNFSDYNKGDYSNTVISKLHSKLSNTLTKIKFHEEKQDSFLQEIRKLNHFLAQDLDHNKNHNLRREECKEKIQELKLRVANVKDNLNSSRNLLLNTVKLNGLEIS